MPQTTLPLPANLNLAGRFSRLPLSLQDASLTPSGIARASCHPRLNNLAARGYPAKAVGLIVAASGRRPLVFALYIEIHLGFRRINGRTRPQSQLYQPFAYQ